MSEKNFLDNLKITLVGYAGAFLLLAFRRSLRLKIILSPESDGIWSGDSPIIVVFWHNQQLMMPWLYLDVERKLSKKPMSVLISQSLDGRFIAKAMAVLGIGSVAGSSSRGGKEALIQLVKLIKSGVHIAITPDGPKGPLHKAKIGALKASQLTGAKILPACFATQKAWRFGSWDKMILPKPFSKSVILSGSLLEVPREASHEEVSKIAILLENELNRLTMEAQSMVDG